MIGGPAMIAAEARAGDKVDHCLDGSGVSLDLMWRVTVPLNLFRQRRVGVDVDTHRSV
jgi:hypothetical protein